MAEEKAKSTKLSYQAMAKEAIATLAEKKGSSVSAIQASICEKYILAPEVVRKHLKPALAKGIENGSFVRPKDSDAKGFTGRFKINKIKEAEDEKAQKAKEKAKAKKEKEQEGGATKKVVPKKRVKSAAGTSTKSPGKKAVKKTPTKKAAKSAAKVPKPKAAKATLKTPKKAPKKVSKAPRATPRSASK